MGNVTMYKPLSEVFGLGRLFGANQSQQQASEFDAKVKANIEYEAVLRLANKDLGVPDKSYQSLGISNPDLKDKTITDWFDVDLYLLDYGYDITRDLD